MRSQAGQFLPVVSCRFVAWVSGRIARGRALRVGPLPFGKHEYGFHSPAGCGPSAFALAPALVRSGLFDPIETKGDHDMARYNLTAPVTYT
jgi:hypothetical protein